MAAADVVGAFVDATITITDDGGNSEALTRFTGAFSVSNLKPDGREPVVAETQGAWIGTRKGARAFPQITFSGLVADYDETFHRLANGITGGFVSTAAGIGDYPAVDIDVSSDYSTDSRTIAADDLELDSWSIETADGGLTQVNFTMTIRGPLSIDGTTYISSR